MDTSDFSKRVTELTQTSSSIDWKRVSDRNYSIFMVLCQEVSLNLSVLTALDNVKRALFRLAFLMTVGVLSALLLKVEGAKIALGCCVATAVYAGWATFVLWGYMRTAIITLKAFDDHVTRQPQKSTEGETEE
jgi:hypothetical protein